MSCSTTAAPARHAEVKATACAYLVKIEYEIKLADVSKISIQNLHKMMYDFQGYELIVRFINAHDKE